MQYQVSDIVRFVVDDKYFVEKKFMGIPVIPRSEFNYNMFEVVVAIGYSAERKNVVDSLPPDTKFTTVIHPAAYVSKNAQIGKGTIVSPGVVVSCDVKLGEHTQLNWHSSVGHDSVAGNFFTAAPGARIGGRCKIGQNVFFGSNSTIRERIEVCDNVIFGMGTVIVNDITEPGVYIGCPAKITT